MLGKDSHDGMVPPTLPGGVQYPPVVVLVEAMEIVSHCGWEGPTLPGLSVMEPGVLADWRLG